MGRWYPNNPIQGKSGMSPPLRKSSCSVSHSFFVLHRGQVDNSMVWPLDILCSIKWSLVCWWIKEAIIEQRWSKSMAWGRSITYSHHISNSKGSSSFWRHQEEYGECHSSLQHHECGVRGTFERSHYSQTKLGSFGGSVVKIKNIVRVVYIRRRRPRFLISFQSASILIIGWGSDSSPWRPFEPHSTNTFCTWW